MLTWAKVVCCRDSSGSGEVVVCAVHGLLHQGVLGAGDHHEAGEDGLLGEGGGEAGADRDVVHDAPPDGGGAGVPQGGTVLVAGLAVAAEGEAGLRVDLLHRAAHSQHWPRPRLRRQRVGEEGAAARL